MNWVRPLMGEWDLTAFILCREMPEALALDAGFCADCGGNRFPCECES